MTATASRPRTSRCSTRTSTRPRSSSRGGLQNPVPQVSPPFLTLSTITHPLLYYSNNSTTLLHQNHTQHTKPHSLLCGILYTCPICSIALQLRPPTIASRPETCLYGQISGCRLVKIDTIGRIYQSLRISSLNAHKTRRIPISSEHTSPIYTQIHLIYTSPL